jgi:DNA-binding transcriptional MerR regulator
MTIKEIEEASGMQRANIRYYEEEGFLNPEREKNGYRNYTEADLNILKKIKLLRSLHVSLEDIKAMHRGTQDLATTLEEHIAYLTAKQQDLEKSKYVCEKMQRDGATYEKLNTEQYLLVLKKVYLK